MATNIYDDAVEQLPALPSAPKAPTSTEAPNPYDTVVDQLDASKEQALRTATVQASTVDPQRASEIKQLSDKTGVAPTIVERNFDTIKRRSLLTDTPYSQMLRDTPKLAEWAAEPVNAKVASDDMDKLGALEWLLSAPQRAIIQATYEDEYATLRSKSMFGELTAAEHAQMETARVARQSGGELGAGNSWFRGAITKTMKLLVSLSQPELIPTAAGAAGGAVIGAAGGAVLGGVGAFPGAVAGAKLGAEAGYTYGLGKNAFQVGSASAYDDFLETTDNLGRKLDPEVAKALAVTSGAVDAGLMVFGGRAIGAGIEAASGKVASMVTRNAIKAAIKQPSVMGAIKEMVLGYGKTMTEGTALMIAMKTNAILMHAMATASGERVPTPGQQEVGNIDLFKQPVVQNADGSTSTVDSFSVNLEGQETLLPTVTPDGRHLSQDAAVAEYQKTGRHLGKFDSPQAATAYAQQLHEDYAAGKYTPQTIGQQLLAAAKEGVQSFALIGLTGPALGLARGLRDAQRAQQGVTFFTALGEGIEQSKTAKRLPEAAQAFITQATKDGPVQTLYTGVADWTEYWQSKGVDPKEMAAHVTGDPAAYDRALATGEDLAIPTARYATKLAATEHNAHFAEELRLGPEEMNGRESKAFIEHMKTLETPAADTPAASPVRQAILDKLAQAGISGPVAEQYAGLLETAGGEGFFGSGLTDKAGELGRGGVDPVKFWEQYGLDISRPDLAAPDEAQSAPSAGEAGAGEASLPLEVRGVTDAHGVPVDAYNGPDRRAAETAGSTMARRSTDDPIPVMADVMAAAAEMRRENPHIDRQAQAMRDQATAAGRIPEPKGRDGVFDKNADATQNPENYLNAEAHAPAASAAPPLSPAEEGAGSRDAQGQQPGADVEGHGQGRGDGHVAESGRPAPRGIPALDEVFERQPREHTEARLTPHIERELRRILDEMQREGYEGKTWDWSPSEEHGKTGNAAGGLANIIGGHGGAPVYDDVLSHSPMNRVTSGERKGQPADEAHGSRAKVERAIAALIDTRHVTSNLMEGALRVAENRDAGIWRDLSRPSILPPWAETVPRAFTDALSEAIDREQQPANLLDERDVQDSVETGDEGDTSFDVSKFYQSLFDDLQPPDPKVDTLAAGGRDESQMDASRREWRENADRVAQNPAAASATDLRRAIGYLSHRMVAARVNMEPGKSSPLIDSINREIEDYTRLIKEHEAQGVLPGDVGAVREQDVKTPAFEAPFSLTSDIAKPTKGGQKTLFQSAYHGSPHKFEEFSLHAIGSGEGAQAYGWGLYFAGNKEVAEFYRNKLSKDPTITIGGEEKEIFKPGNILHQHGAEQIVLNRLRAKFSSALGELTAAQVARGVESEIQNSLELEQGRKGKIYESLLEQRRVIEKMLEAGIDIKPGGRLFTVDIPDEEHYLDYDKPASQQSPIVQAALKKLGIEWETFKPKTVAQWDRYVETKAYARLFAEDVGIRAELVRGHVLAQSGDVEAFNRWQGQHQGLLGGKGMIDPIGRSIYEQLQMNVLHDRVPSQMGRGGDTLSKAAEGASKMLAAEGVAGIRYLDASSRDAGKGSSNYVVFDDKLVKITEFNQLEQQPAPLTPENVDAWAKEVKDRAGPDLSRFELSLNRNGDIALDWIMVDRGAQRAGLGSKVMLELTRFADLNGRRIVLSPAEDAGSTRANLVKFYKKFGFVENKGRSKDFAISAGMYREPTAIPGRDYSGQSASAESHPDGAGLHAKLFTDLFKGEPLTPEGDRLASAPSLVSMIGKVRAVALVDPEVFGAIIRAAPVDMVDNFFGSKAAAEEALRNDPMFQDRAAVDAQLPVAESVDAASPVSLLLREIARLAAEDGPVADAAGKAADGRAATGTGEGDSFSQPRRASIRFGPDRQFTISLLERADLSSFLHETGHFFLEVFGDVADNLRQADPAVLTEAQQHILRDYDATLRHLGVETRADIGTAHHEAFARTFEAYLMEGQAPAPEMRVPFARFRAWLLGIYGSLKQLNVRLTPEVRGVLDRLLASDQAIQEAEAQRGVGAMFTTPERAGMEPREFELYARVVQDAHQDAQQKVDQRLMREVAREQTREWKARREEIQTEVEGQVHQKPEYGAISAMRLGTHPNGEPLVEGLITPPLQLSRAILEDRWPGRAKRLPRGVVTGDGGLDPDLIAGMFGYSSADALLTAVEKAPPMKDVIASETKRRMVEEHGSILLDGTLHEKAQAATANETHDEVIRAEMRALGRLRRTVEPFVKAERAQGAEALQQEQAERAYERRWFEAEAKLRIAIAEGHKQVEIDELTRQVGELKAKARGGAAVIRNAIPDAATLREAAAARINAMRIGEIQPATFWSASRRAGQQALEKAARQDFDGAITAKQQELLNLALYRHAEQALEDIDDRVRFAKSLGTPAARKMFGLAGQSYLDQVDGILDRFEFATVSQKVLDRRGSLQKFVEGLESQGLPVDLPDELLDESRRRNYKQLTVEELQGVTDGLKELQHLARLKNRLLRRDAQRTLDETAATIGQSIRDHFTGAKPDVSRDRTTGETGRMIANFMASHVRLADFTREMDGGVDGGPLTTAVMYRLNEAGGKEAEMSAAATKALGDLFETAYPLSQKRQLFEKLEIPAIGKSLSKMERLMYALNWGNEGNRQRIRTYEKWTDDQVGAILNTLDARDLTLVQGILDHVNSYKDAIIAKQERVYGVAPTMVDPTPIRTAIGEIPGGYFPLKYDDRLTGKAENFEAGNLAKLASYNNATTARGHTKERVSNVKMPLQLNPGVIFSHVQQVIHDLTHHEALIDIGRILAHSDVMKAILETHGDIAYKHMKDALRDVAIGQPRSTEGFSNVLAHFRSGAAIANLGWSMTVPMLHLSGALPKGINAIGAEWAAKGIMRWFRGPEAMQSTAEWINANNLGMANRGRTQTRELSEIRSAFGIDTGRFSGWVAEVLDKTTLGTVDKQKIADSYFYLVTKSQQIADYVVYLGQFEKSRAAGESEARAHQIAEQRVLDAFGGGQNKDLPSVMRGGALLKTWTTFYGPFNSTFNAMRHATKRVDGTALSVGRLGVDYLMLWAVPAVLGWGVRAAMQSGAAGSSEDWNAKTLAGELGRAGVAYLADMMVGTRELAGAIHGYHNYEGPAGASIFAKLGHLYQVGEHAAQKIAAGQGDEVVNGATFKALDDVGGIMFHYPAGQLGRTVGGLAALIDGRTQNPAALLFGAPPKPK